MSKYTSCFFLGFPPLNRHQQCFGFVDGFHVFAVGVAVGDDAGAGLDVEFALVDDGGAQGDAGVHGLAIGGKVPDAPAVGAASIRL